MPALPTADEHEAGNATDDGSTSSPSSGEDRRAFGVRQALPLAHELDAGLSDSEYEVDDEARAAAVYLAAVRSEAAGVRGRVVAVPGGACGGGGGGSAAAEASPPLPQTAASDAVGPGDPWLVPFLEQFAALRAAVAEVRQKEGGDGDGGCRPSSSLPRDAAGWAAALAAPPPPGLASSLTQPALVGALERVAAASGAPPPPRAPGSWRGNGGEAPPATPPHHQPPPLPGQTAAWAFSLAAGLERPLPPAVGSALRSLGRAAGAAARRAGDAGGGDEEGVDTAAALASAAVVAAVAGAYFAQDEALCVVAREEWP